MLLFSKKSSDPEEEQIFPARRDSFSPAQVIVYLINVAIGTGVVKLAVAYRAGALFSPILSAIMALISGYSFVIFLKAACWAKSSTFEEVWAKVFGQRTVIICATINILAKFVVLRAYTSTTIDMVRSLVLEFYPTAPVYFTDQYVIITVVYIVFYIPVFCSKSLKVIAAISYVKVFCLAFICCVILYRFGAQVKEQGFDPDGSIAYFRFDSTAITCLDSLLTAYQVMPLCYPGIRHVSRFTVKSFMRVIKLTMLIFWIVYNIVGEICYFTVWDSDMGSTILDWYPDDTLNLISRVALTVMMVYTWPMALNPARFIMVNLVAKGKDFPAVVWALIGIFFAYFGVVVMALPAETGPYMTLILNIPFMFPPILYLKAFKCRDKLHCVGAIFLLLFGLGTTAFVFWLAYQ